jgi:hypothetical protein
MSTVHVHKCVVYECHTLVECDGDCMEGKVPKVPACPVHLPMYEACERVLDEGGYTEVGEWWYLHGVRQGRIPRIG